MDTTKNAPKLVVALVIAMALALGSAPAAEAAAGSLTLAPGEAPRIEVELSWGAMTVTAGDPEEVTWTEIADSNIDGQRWPEGRPLRIEQTAEVVRLIQETPPAGVFEGVELALVVPPESDLVLRMLRGGEVRVEGIGGEVAVTNLNGSVVLERLTGAATVNATNGSIAASFRRVSGTDAMAFVTLNGSVELCMPRDLAADLHLTTAGDPIASDFALVLPAKGGAADRREVRARVGGGGFPLRAATLNGEIRLERCD